MFRICLTNDYDVLGRKEISHCYLIMNNNIINILVLKPKTAILDSPGQPMCNPGHWAKLALFVDLSTLY